MKTILLCVVLSLVWWQVKAQIPQPEKPVMESMAEDTNPILIQPLQCPPIFPDESREFLYKNFKYPRNARRMGIRGKVFVRFLVTKTGEITEVNIVKGITNCPECNEEAIRLVKMMPKLIPASRNGEFVSWHCTLPINFKLDDDYIVIVAASFQGGTEAWQQYLQQNLKYPKKAKKKKIEGQVTIQFSVETDGKITEASVKTGLPTCPECDAEALRLVQAMPAWKAQMRNGNAEKSKNEVVIPFKLEKK